MRMLGCSHWILEGNMRRLRAATSNRGALLVLATIAMGCGKSDEIDVRCEPVEAGAGGCTGLPEGAGSSSATYPVACEVRVEEEGETTVWFCQSSGRWSYPL